MALRKEQERAINAQIREVHERIAQRIRQQPELISLAREKLQQRYDHKLIRHGSYINWLSILEYEDDIEQLVSMLCEDSFMMDKLRRQSPFVGLDQDET